MTTTDLAVINAEVVELTPKQAKALDKQVRATSDRVSKGFTTLDETIGLLGNQIQQAIDGEIHKGLGLKSWTVWVKDAVRVTVPDRFQRKELVRELSKSGLTQRALASVFNVAQKTIDRDLDGQEFESATVTSLDGAERPRNGKVKDVEEEPLEVEAEEIVEPIKAIDIVSAFYDETANLFAAANELTQLTLEEKWDGARRRVAKANMNDVVGVISTLQLVVDDLMTGAS